jgi:hypothetical protein
MILKNIYFEKNNQAKNTAFARAFIMDWANMQYTQPKNFSGADNGALQLHILRTVIPGARAEAKVNFKNIYIFNLID